jgi:SAM-dependent methyltransferase
MIRTFIRWNERLSKRIEPWLPQARLKIYPLYDETVARYMNEAPHRLVVDVGGGKTCAFARLRDPQAAPRIVGVDVSEEELAANSDLDEKHVADVTQGLPFDDATVDLVVSKTLLEHLGDVEAFILHARRALKPGGCFINLFPGKFASFSLINQALPRTLARKVLYFFKPGNKPIAGFPAYYDRCYYSAFTALLRQHGFSIEEAYASYYAAHYYSFFFPLYAVAALYEMAVQGLGFRNLCAFVLVVARKE